MVSKQRVSLQLDADAVKRLNELTSERRKGEFVSALILQAATVPTVPPGGILERIEARLTQIEATLEELAARR